MLDQQSILSEISFDIPDTTSAQLPLKPAFYDSDNTKVAAEHFLQSFYQLYDNNRQGLADLYDDIAAFSYAIDDTQSSTTGPPQRKRPESWAAWHSNSRNLHKLKDPGLSHYFCVPFVMQQHLQA